MVIQTISRLAFYSALLVISALALLPQQQASVSLGWDKANHCAAFFVLLLLLDIAYPRIPAWWHKCAALFAYGVLIETIQMLLPDRYASVEDLLANVIGLSLYLLVRPHIVKWLDKDLQKLFKLG